MMTFLLNLFNQKNKSIKHANSLINIVLFTTEDYGFYTDLYSYAKKSKNIDLIKNPTFLKTIVEDAYNSYWEMDTATINTLLNINYYDKQIEIRLFEKKKVRVYDIKNKTFNNKIKFNFYIKNKGLLVGDGGYLLEVNGVVIKKYITMKF